MNFEDLEVGMKLRVTKSNREMRMANNYHGMFDRGDDVVVQRITRHGPSHNCHFKCEGESSMASWMHIDFVEPVEPSYDWMLNPDMKTFGDTPREFQMKFFEARLDGETIQNAFLGDWHDIARPSFGLDAVYRLKPKKTPEEIEIEELEAKIPTLRAEFESLADQWAELSEKEGKAFRDSSREEKGAILLARHENMENVQFWSADARWRTSDRRQTPNNAIYRIKPANFDEVKAKFDEAKAALSTAEARLMVLKNTTPLEW